MNTTDFYAGAARVQTTPPLGTRINGDFVTHYANYIHDDLYSKALVLQQGQTRIVFVVVDICVMPKDFLDGVKEMIRKETGILPANVLISSTHTHAAGSVSDVHLGSVDLAYRDQLPALILKSVAHALQKLAPAQIGFGAFDALEHLLCRRYFMKEGYVPFNPVNNGSDLIKTNPFGGEEFIEVSVAPTDPQLSYLAVKGLDGNWISILGNYSLHYVGDWENGTISADYFGVFSEELATLLNAGNDFVGMMSNGTSGDVNIWDFLNPDRYPKENFAKSKLIGSDLAGRLVQSLEKVTWQQNPDLSVLYEDIEIEVIKPSVADILAASEIVAAADYENLIVNQEGLKQLYAREQLMLNVSDNKRTCVIQAVKVGSGIIGALSGEFFSETGLYLKNQIDSEHYFTITMANGNAGYVPPAEEIARGGYETWRCRYSCLVPEAEEVLRQKLVALTRSL